jgi:thioesterase domain-containing protein
MGKTLSISSGDLLTLDSSDRWPYVVEQLKRIQAISEDSSAEAIDDILERWWRRMRLVQEYCPRRYAGRITLFRSTERDNQLDEDWKDLAQRLHRDPTRGWGDLSTVAVEIHDVPGYHATMGSEPHVQVLAAKVRDCLC